MAAAVETLSAFRAAAAAARGRSPSFPVMRDEAFAFFETTGLPTTRMEAWRSTSVAALAKIPFQPPPDATVASALARESFIPGHAGPRVVLINGRLDAELSSLGSLPAGLRIERLALSPSAAFRIVPATGEGAFPALNAALLEDGIVIDVARGAVVASPIHVLCLTDGRGEPVVSSPRVVVTLGESAQATLVETHVGWAGETLTNGVIEIDLQAGSVLEHVQAQRLGPSATLVLTTRARLARSATYRSHVFSLGARLSRHGLTVDLAGEGAGCELFGTSLLGDAQHADHHTFIDHAVPHASSRQVYKGAFAGASRGVFNGAVRVRKDAQKTDAHQQNRNLILSRDALVDSKPELEIHADDVRCTHGATIGQMDEDQLFYLVARGIGAAEARGMLVRAFVDEQVARVSDAAVRADLALRVGARVSELVVA